MSVHPPFEGDYSVTAGWRYSSGAGHFAYDYACPLGTPLFAVGDGTVLDCADGSPNDDPGDPNYAGEPSNWVLLGTRWRDRDVSVYYQHMSPGLNVHRGERVKAGHLIGRSGNSGNSSGPHLHLAAMYGHQNAATRYCYMINDGTNPWVIYPPDRLWEEDDDMALSGEAKDWLRKMVEQEIRRGVWQHSLPTPNGENAESFHRAATRWQRRTVATIAQVTAEVTVDTLQASGLAAGVDGKALAKQVAARVVAEFAELQPTDDTVAPPPE